jgi:hypothetical protein
MELSQEIYRASEFGLTDEEKSKEKNFSNSIKKKKEILAFKGGVINE